MFRVLSETKEWQVKRRSEGQRNTRRLPITNMKKVRDMKGTPWDIETWTECLGKRLRGRNERERRDDTHLPNVMRDERGIFPISDSFTSFYFTRYICQIQKRLTQYNPCIKLAQIHFIFLLTLNSDPIRSSFRSRNDRNHKRSVCSNIIPYLISMREDQTPSFPPIRKGEVCSSVSSPFFTLGIYSRGSANWSSSLSSISRNGSFEIGIPHSIQPLVSLTWLLIQ